MPLYMLTVSDRILTFSDGQPRLQPQCDRVAEQQHASGDTARADNEVLR